MDMNDYQKQALKSVAIKQRDLAALAHRTLGVAGEAGELANIVKKIIRYKDGEATAEDIQKITEKLGDVLYYTATLAKYYDIPLEEIAAKNLIKSQAFKKSHN